MTHPLLTRAHLEAVLIATAVVRRELAPWIADRVDRDRFSVAGWALLAQLATSPAERLARTEFFPLDGTVWARTKGQLALMQRVDAVTIEALCFWPLDVLLDLVNQLPDRRDTAEPAAWERDLARAVGSAADHAA